MTDDSETRSPQMRRRGRGRLSFFDAAVEVLREVGEPMTTRQLVDQALARGFIAPSGRTPLATMSARLYTGTQKAGSPIVRLYAEGRQRATRGSVQWALTPKSSP